MPASFPDRIWSIDITYIPIQKSWLYLAAIIDWYSRYILAWEINDTLEISFVLAASRRALGNARPIIMNSDQGSRFTSPKYTELFLAAGSKISMDHRGRVYDNRRFIMRNKDELYDFRAFGQAIKDARTKQGTASESPSFLYTRYSVSTFC